ncbi:hypothetical protein GGI35DRAFT_442803 [Trichoderma velutinum]
MLHPSQLGFSRGRGLQDHKLLYNSLLEQGLCESKENITSWQVAGGFITRRDEVISTKAGVLILAKFTSVKNSEGRKNLLQHLDKFCNWVQTNEPSTYTYCVLTSQTVAEEVLLVERYKDLSALKEHSRTKEMQSMLEQISPLIIKNNTEMSEWNEVDGFRFVNLGVTPKVRL